MSNGFVGFFGKESFDNAKLYVLRRVVDGTMYEAVFLMDGRTEWKEQDEQGNTYATNLLPLGVIRVD